MRLNVIAAAEDSEAYLEHPERGLDLGQDPHAEAAGHDHHHGHNHHHELAHRLGAGHSHDPRIFSSPDHSPSGHVLGVLAAGLRDVDLAAPPVVMPDFYHKHNMEMPSSIAVATRNTVHPTLTSAAVNCGMALITFDSERPTADRIAEFYRRVKETYPFPPTMRRDITFDEVLKVAELGAAYAIDRWSIAPEEIDRVEEGGRLDIERYGGGSRAREELPWLITQLSRLRFGTIGPSTHFVELQEVEEVLDPGLASLLGVTQGQIALQFHAGGGTLTGAIGAMYGSRRAGSRLLKAIMAFQKPLHHLAGARSFEELRTRFDLYFKGGCPPVPRDHPEGQRLMLANDLAMNYGFAFRMKTYSDLRRLAADSFGASSHLIVDSPHNSIYEEEVGGELALVHRHNTARAYGPQRMAGHPVFGQTGQAILVPGTNRTCSYLCVGADGGAEGLFSACHGTGSIIDDFARRGVSHSDPEGHATLRFRYDAEEPALVKHLDNRGVDEGVAIMTKAGLVRPVARLRPFAVLN